MVSEVMHSSFLHATCSRISNDSPGASALHSGGLGVSRPSGVGAKAWRLHGIRVAVDSRE